ncbi:carboxymuconolactone decarboxylase family protein [Sphingobium sp. HBC34]|uniref:Carboxymuconolactone decarboxylase family protein n=1 Tax=Sphingobium cyanobacteriorum TaxID=3063954 RepID=A0ABT8ZI18_9SPHN|nr:carboxymuconolactone decarboxylase family protein [Sphingobium sp. HBC34]MDO7833425.1 carboxymuconolactone decarboxylase family protein [Sphingobium sp. HBC34]
MNDITERGLTLFAEIMGDQPAGQLRASLDGDDFGAAIGKLATDFAFGSVWAREGLERKQRSLVVIGVLIALRQMQELKNHIRIGLTNGLTVGEIEEALIQTIPYVGFPAAASATSAIIEVLRERNLATGSRTAEERGLL